MINKHKLSAIIIQIVYIVVEIFPRKQFVQVKIKSIKKTYQRKTNVTASSFVVYQSSRLYHIALRRLRLDCLHLIPTDKYKLK